ncbi:hypothetical protein [Morganella psychrotolerans]|uniref:hypothetical protein n=1 Tax=Morganella psychrotolerans TaxID=368603 RepID=UPI0039AF7895
MFNFIKNNNFNKLSLSITFISIISTSTAYSAVNGPSGKYNKSKNGEVVWSVDITETITVTKSGTSDYTYDRTWATLFGIGGYQYYMWDCRRNTELRLGSSSNGLYTGMKISDDIILFLSGTATGKIGSYSGSGTWSENGVYSSNSTPNSSYSWCSSVKKVTNFSPGDYSTFSGKISLYIGPNAKLGNAYIPEIWLFKGLKNAEDVRTLLMSTSVIEIMPPRSCTVSTDNTITFPPVDVSDAKNNQALANKTGNLTVNCDDTSNTPVTVEIQGTKGRYTDTMALTMKDGSDAPAEVRGFIGKDIPLTGQCNGRLDGYSGIVYFIPNAGLEKMTLTPGTSKYNWVLCSKGQNKTGQATGSAKLILNWN